MDLPGTTPQPISDRDIAPEEVSPTAPSSAAQDELHASRDASRKVHHSDASQRPSPTAQIAEVVALLAGMMQLAQPLIPLAQSAVEARSKRLNAQPELEALRDKLIHERVLDHQRRYWEFYMARDKMVGRLMFGWTMAFIVVVGAGVFAIHKKVIDQQSAVTLGLIIAGAMGWAGSRVSGRPSPPGNPPNAPPT